MNDLECWVGIDPGKTGGVAVLGADGSLRLDPIPVVRSSKGRAVYDVAGFCRLVASWYASGEYHVRLATVEQLHALPRTLGGGLANFSRGEAMGVAWALAAMSIPFQLVSPQRWQKAMLSGAEGRDTKQRAAVAAARLFPKVDWRGWSKAARVGLADAALLAEYGRRTS